MNTPDKGVPKWFGICLGMEAPVTTDLAYRLRRLISPPERWIDDLRDSAIAHGLLRGYARGQNGSLCAPLAGKETHG